MRLSVTVVLFGLVSKKDNSTTKSIMEVDGGLYILKSITALPLIVKLKAVYSKLTNVSWVKVKTEQTILLLTRKHIPPPMLVVRGNCMFYNQVWQQTKK